MFRFLTILTCAFCIISTAAIAQPDLFSTNPKDDDVQPAIFPSLPPDIQDAIIAEAETIRNRCMTRSSMPIYHDCDCIGAKFLEERALDPEIHQNVIVDKLLLECPNIPGVAGEAYNGCKRTSGHLEYKTAEAFCHCVGNEAAKSFKAHPVDHLQGYQGYMISARGACTKKLGL